MQPGDVGAVELGHWGARCVLALGLRDVLAMRVRYDGIGSTADMQQYVSTTAGTQVWVRRSAGADIVVVHTERSPKVLIAAPGLVSGNVVGHLWMLVLGPMPSMSAIRAIPVAIGL